MERIMSHLKAAIAFFCISLYTVLTGCANSRVYIGGTLIMAKKLFNVNKALGITKTKRKIAKATGVPTTKSGRQAKVGRMFGIK